MKRKTVALAVLAMLSSFSVIGANTAFAEESEFILDEMVVTATRTEATLFDTNANVSVVTRKEIENKHYLTVGDAIKNLPGVNVQNMGSTGEAYADNTLYINGSKNIVVLIDGARVNFNGGDAEKFSSADMVDMSMIEKIEVLKGSASTLYGSDAQGGVINIVTRKGTGDEFHGKAHYAAGSFHQRRGGVFLNGNERNINWMVSASKNKSGAFEDGQGRRVPESIDSTTYSAKLGIKMDDKNDLNIAYRKQASDYARIKPAKGKDYSKLAPIYGEKDNDNLLVNYVHKFSNATQNVLNFTRNYKDVNDNYTAAKPVVYEQTSYSLSDQVTSKIGEHHTLIGGVEFTHDQIDHASQTITDKGFHNMAYYVQDIWNFDDKLNLTYGIRFDDHSMYGHQNSPSAALGYKLSENTNAYASFKTYFIAPTASQLYSSGSGNPNLDCETGKTFEIGVKHRFAKDMSLDLNAYKRRSKDAIGLLKNADGQSVYTNYDDEKAKGFSAKLDKKWGKFIHTNVGYTYIYIDPQVNKNPNRNGYLPRGAWNIEVGYDNDKFSFDIDGRGIINRDGRKADKNVQATTFWVWNAVANYKVAKNINVYGRINNIFDTNYTERCYALSPEEWFASPGRNYMVGLEYSF